MIQAEVVKAGSESSLAVIRKFSRRVQGTGLVQTVRGGRYHTRNTSKVVKKKRALKRISRRDAIQKLIKEGKMTEPTGRRGAHQREDSPRREQNSSNSKLGETTPIAR